MKLATQAVVSSSIAFALFITLLFLPAGTFDYWQAWVFIAAVRRGIGSARHLFGA